MTGNTFEAAGQIESPKRAKGCLTALNIMERWSKGGICYERYFRDDEF